MYGVTLEIYDDDDEGGNMMGEKGETCWCPRFIYESIGHPFLPLFFQFKNLSRTFQAKLNFNFGRRKAAI